MAPKPKLTDELRAAIQARKVEQPDITTIQLAEEFSLNRDTVAKALASAAPAAKGDIIFVTLDQLCISPHNPRKTFTQASIEELAQGIRLNGLLQNLVVCPHPDAIGYNIVAGERRYRAIRHLDDLDAWDMATTIPCRLVPADAGANLALALLENLARENVPPLEEADAFAQLQKLDPAAWSAPNIAARIGKTTRYVYQRLSLASKLAPESRAALSANLITIDAARLLTTTSTKIQADIIKRKVKDDETLSASDLSWEITNTLFNTRDALFDVDASGLELLDVDGESFFADKTTAAELQMQAVREKERELKKFWHFVKVLKPGQQFESWLYDSGKRKAQGGGAIITIDKKDFEVKIHTGLIKKVEKPKVTSAAPERDYVAEQKKQAEKRAAAERKQREALFAITPRLNSDYPQYPSPISADDEEEIDMTAPMPNGGQDCANKCKHRAMLDHPLRYLGFYLCTNPASPRAGLLTWKHQAGVTCFEPTKK